MTVNTVLDLIRRQADLQPEAAALLAPGRPALTYRGLVEQAEAAAADLAAMGVRRGDRVALALPNGPEAAVAFLAVASLATCAPLNPAYSTREFEFYLSDLKARLLLVGTGGPTPPVDAAGTAGIRAVELRPRPEAPAGVFSLPGGGSGAAPLEAAGPDEVALVLHTSGTTSRPKLVPLTQANLTASAGNIAASLELVPRDRCLNVMPLFHVHGLIGAVLASLAAGASVICTPGPVSDQVMSWMAELGPTWYTAVPTMHQAILEAAGREGKRLGQVRLRFIRSCSSALSPQLGQRLEETFHAPVIEAYGMTEAAHQIACNPLPPRPHKFGSVGLPTGAEAAILDEQGAPLPPGVPGEIAIRGANVMHGYVENPAANAAAFTNGWLRTGDRGYRDEEGYLFIQARLKEMINRGGEKISPREVDEALLQHPAVSQAVAFAVPHASLGEDVAAAVVLRPEETVTAGELRRFAAGRIAGFKVPRRIVFVAEIPKGPTGKVQRLVLAEKLKAELEAAGQERGEYVPPRSPTETALAQAWQEVLGGSPVGATDDFFLLGGDSLGAARALARVNSRLGTNLTLQDFFETISLAALAERIDGMQNEPRPES